MAAAPRLGAMGLIGPPSPLSARATALLGQIHQARHLGRPGNSPYCVLEVGAVYVQALARAGCSTIQLEVVSAKSNVAVAATLTRAKVRLLTALGFAPPGPRSPNYWQEVEIAGQADLDRAGRLMAAALTFVYGIGDPGLVIATLAIPSPWAPPTAPAKA